MKHHTPANRALLACGAAAGPLYLSLGIGQLLLRDGFDMRRHALSLMSNGSFGWVQVTSFILSGCLVVAGALGMRKLLRGQPAGTWGPILLAVYGLGLIGSGLFRADPALGFPPGTPLETGPMSRDGMLHFVCGAVAFYALIAAALVFARRFRRERRRGAAAYSLFTAVGFFLAFAAIASGPASPAVMLTFYGAVTWIWLWHTWLLWHFCTQTGPSPAS